MTEHQYPCYYPGEFSPPTKLHLNTVHWLLSQPDISHVHIVIGKDMPGQPTQDQKAKLWEMLLKSKFAPQASIVKSKDSGPVTEIYNTFNTKRNIPAFVALDEKAARNKQFQAKFEGFPYYGIQLVPSQFSKQSKALLTAVQEGNTKAIKSYLPEDFSDEMVSAYSKILKTPEPAEDEYKSVNNGNYKEQYAKMFDDGFWKSVFKPMSESVELDEAMAEKKRAQLIAKFKKENPALEDEHIDYYIDTFTKYKDSSVLKGRDLFQFKFSELEQIIDKNFPKTTGTKTDKDEVDFKGSEDVVYNENGLLILLGDLKDKCVRYGKGYSWCISRKDASNMFFSYRMRLNEPVFYFVFDEDKPKTDVYHAMVIYINSEGKYFVTTADNPGDKEKTWSEIEGLQPKLKGLKGLFKHIPLTAEERKDYERFKNKLSDSEYAKLTYEEKEKYIGFGHDLTEAQVRDTPKALISKYATTTAGENIPGDILKSLPPSDVKKMIDNLGEFNRSLSDSQFLSIGDKLKTYYIDKIIEKGRDLTDPQFEFASDGQKSAYIDKIIGEVRDLTDPQFKMLSDRLKTYYIDKRIEKGLYLSYSQFEFASDKKKSTYIDKILEIGMYLPDPQFEFASDGQKNTYIDKIIESGWYLKDSQFKFANDKQKSAYLDKIIYRGRDLTNQQFEFASDKQKIAYIDKRIELGLNLTPLQQSWYEENMKNK